MALSWPGIALDVLITSLQLFVEACFTARFIRTRRTVLFCSVFVLINITVYSVFEYLLPSNVGIADLCLLAVTFAINLLFTKCSRIRTVLFILLTHIFTLSIDFGITFLYRAVLPEAIEEIASLFIGDLAFGSLPSMLLLLFRITGVFEVSIGALAAYLVLRGKEPEHTGDDKRMDRFLPVFLLEIAAVGLLLWYTASVISANVTVLWLLIGIFAMFFILDVLVWNILLSVENAARLRQEKAELSLIAEAQAIAYEHISEGNRRFRALRHDMLNQLQTAGILLERGDTEAAAKQLGTYANDIRDSGKSVTGNSIADAVLSIKDSVCKEAGIALEVSGSLPEQVPLEHSELCGLIGNMLDNAIHAALAIQTEAEKRIRFSVGIRDSKLILSCTNPSDKPLPQKAVLPGPEEEHGWGLYILKKKAEARGGAFTLNEKDGFVSAVFWIPLEKEEVSA